MIIDSMSLFSLCGRSVVVAGASRGIGAAIAAGLASAGAAVHTCGRSAQPIEPVDGVDYQQCDVADEAAFAGLCRKAAGARETIDALVYAAGITVPSERSPQSADDFARTVAVNLTAAYRAAMAAVPWMRSPSSIVFVTSINSVLGFPGNPAYVASKGGLRQLTKALALDLGPRGIRVNALAPGYIRTRMTESSYSDPAMQAARTARTMLGRWGEPADLVGPALFLVSDASSYVTGQDLFVDGGWTAKGL